MQTEMQRALSLASEGFYVFPCIGKKPALKGWQAAATRDADQIRDWWTRRPDLNVAIATEKFGDGSEAVIAVDVDQRPNKNGHDQIVKLELEGFELPDTRRQNTPSGGYHLIYRHSRPVKQSAGALGPGIDIRSRGGYVVAYSDDGRPPVEAPAWLPEKCGGPRERSAEPAAPPVAVNPDRAWQRAVQYLQQDAPPATAGSRNDAGFRTAARLKDFGLDRDACLAAMGEHWRCDPPLDSDELQHVVNSAYRYGQERQGIADPAADFEPVAPAPAKRPRFAERSYTDLKTAVRPKWLVDRLIPENGLGVVYGPPKAGKTFWLFDLSLCVASGRDFHGAAVQQGRVTYVAAEGGIARLRDRVTAWIKNGKVDETAVDAWGLVPERVTLTDPRQVDEFISALDGPRALIVFDTLARCMAGDENSQADMGALVAGCDRIRTATGAAVLLVHHEGKDATKGARGSTVLRGAIDTGIRARSEAGQLTVTVEDQRDGEPVAPMTYELRSVAVDGLESSAALVPFTAPKLPPLTPTAERALEILRATIETQGEAPPTALGLAPEIRITRMKIWRDECANLKLSRGNAEAQRKAFQRAVETLGARIETHNDFVWLQ